MPRRAKLFLGLDLLEINKDFLGFILGGDDDGEFGMAMGWRIGMQGGSDFII